MTDWCVIRGGSWVSVADFCRSACRSRYEPSFRDYVLGFRVIKKSCQGHPVLRGGSWDSNQDYARAVARCDGLPDDRLDDLGFRVIKQQSTL